jgi:hypothetical protein
MTRPTHLVVFALTTMLLAAAGVRADVIKWDYSWDMNPESGKVRADKPGRGRVVFTLEQPGEGTNTSEIVAANLSTVSKASAKHPAPFHRRGFYTLTLTLTDDQSGQSGSVTFAGKISGTLSKHSADLSNAYIGGTTKTLNLGNYQYSVTIDPMSPPGPPGSNTRGSIAADVVVSSLHVDDAPEPSALVLSCLGSVGLLGLGGRHLRRRVTVA